MPKADLVSRFLAALIDGIVAGVLSLVPLVGFLAGGVYTLTKDGIMYELTKNPEYKGRSIGKKLLRLTVVRVDGGPVDLRVSAKRNLTLALGGLIGIVPLLGWVIGPFVSLVLGVVELLLVLGDPLGRRLGDKWAGTQVVAETATLPARAEPSQVPPASPAEQPRPQELKAEERPEESQPAAPDGSAPAAPPVAPGEAQEEQKEEGKEGPRE
ncbi:RDD family protein [Gelria sp. Kuro-4]|uniref:RDD family protein n=1 Tax=Gelria sp. Kuro-4 TaxID=2796927 RepID=UPI001BF0967E|nr:RDD family protein [Gelria sp. Kuro-4]BCV25981.1 hypothetical protein kuro4_27540 [Gelria sp. Kuro-4]